MTTKHVYETGVVVRRRDGTTYVRLLEIGERVRALSRPLLPGTVVAISTRYRSAWVSWEGGGFAWVAIGDLTAEELGPAPTADAAPSPRGPEALRLAQRVVEIWQKHDAEVAVAKATDARILALGAQIAEAVDGMAPYTGADKGPTTAKDIIVPSLATGDLFQQGAQRRMVDALWDMLCAELGLPDTTEPSDHVARRRARG